jgi:hypothetical protein
MYGIGAPPEIAPGRGIKFGDIDNFCESSLNLGNPLFINFSG